MTSSPCPQRKKPGGNPAKDDSGSKKLKKGSLVRVDEWRQGYSNKIWAYTGRVIKVIDGGEAFQIEIQGSPGTTITRSRYLVKPANDEVNLDMDLKVNMGRRIDEKPSKRVCAGMLREEWRKFDDGHRDDPDPTVKGKGKGKKKSVKKGKVICHVDLVSVTGSRATSPIPSTSRAPSPRPGTSRQRDKPVSSTPRRKRPRISSSESEEVIAVEVPPPKKKFVPKRNRGGMKFPKERTFLFNHAIQDAEWWQDKAQKHFTSREFKMLPYPKQLTTSGTHPKWLEPIRLDNRKVRCPDIVCKVDKKDYTTLSSWRRHFAAEHLGLRSYFCRLCGREFFQTSHLRMHLIQNHRMRKGSEALAVAMKKTGQAIRHRLWTEYMDERAKESNQKRTSGGRFDGMKQAAKKTEMSRKTAVDNNDRTDCISEESSDYKSCSRHSSMSD